MEEIIFSWSIYEGRLRQCKNVLPDGLNWLRYLAGSSKSHRENSIGLLAYFSQIFFFKMQNAKFWYSIFVKNISLLFSVEEANLTNVEYVN